jgi:hypothetical protein
MYNESKTDGYSVRWYESGKIKSSAEYKYGKPDDSTVPLSLLAESQRVSSIDFCFLVVFLATYIPFKLVVDSVVRSLMM